MSLPDGSGWRRAYREAPHVLHEFACAEDPDGLVLAEMANALGPAAEGGGRLLELGCGTRCFGGELASALGWSWIGLDSAPAVLQAAVPPPNQLGKSTLLCARAESNPLADQSVDAVLATWMFGYLAPRVFTACLDECNRVLQPGSFVYAVENGAHPNGMPADGDVDRLLAAGFQEIAEVETELRFKSADRAAAVTRFLMGDLAPTVDARGGIPHRVKLLRLAIR